MLIVVLIYPNVEYGAVGGGGGVKQNSCIHVHASSQQLFSDMVITR